MKHILILIISLSIFPIHAESKNEGEQPASAGLSNIDQAADAENLLTEDSITEEDTLDASSPEEETDDLMVFLFKEVLPSLKGFQNIQPSFKIHFNSQGVTIEQCSVKFMIEQTQTIHYNLLGLELYEYTSDVEIGQPRFFDVELLCADNLNFQLNISILDSEKKPSLYRVKINSSEDESRVELYLKSLQFNASIQSSDQQMGIDEKGNIYPIKQTENTKETENIEEEQTDEQFTAKTIYTLDGKIEFLMPIVGGDGVVSKAPSTVSVSGNIYVSDTDEWIHSLDIVSK